MTGNETFSSVAIISRSFFRHFYPALAKVIRERHGSTIHLYCNTPEQKREYETIVEPGVFDSITCVELVPDSWPTNLDVNQVFARARAFESRYDFTYNSLAVGNRHFGRGYALGGLYYARSRQSEEMTYAHVVHAYNENLAFWEKEIADKRFTLILQPQRPEATIARANGIPVRCMEPARLGMRYLWAVDEFQKCLALEESFHRITDPTGGPTIAKPTMGHLKARDSALQFARWSTTLRRIGLTIAQHMYWRLRGYRKGRRNYLWDEITYRLRQRRDMRMVTSSKLPKMDMVKRHPYVLFTLHTEPERALQGLSPEYFFQLSCIASISRDLPAGVMLVVKEHAITVGKRPRDFYRQIQEFKNVIMVDVREIGLELVRGAAAVVTITGSSGYEAATMGKPTVIFGRHAMYDFLPHVRVVHDELELGPYLNEFLRGDFDPAQPARDGARFLKSVSDNSFEMDVRLDTDPKAFNDAIVEECLRLLVGSLRYGAVVEDPITGKRPKAVAETARPLQEAAGRR